jgi:phenol 2-monooxygenase
VHDAVNLAWKLGGVLNGWYKPEILETYSPERRAIAQHLIKLDKSISTLISGHIPEDYTGNAQKGDANSVLLDVVESSSEFTIGLGVAYEPDGLLNKASRLSIVRAGRRAPDVLVRKPGSRLPTRLYELTKNNGKFWIIVFAGEPLRTAGSQLSQGQDCSLTRRWVSTSSVVRTTTSIIRHSRDMESQRPRVLLWFSGLMASSHSRLN